MNLSRRHLALLEREEYGVCEKSDGERYMLLLQHGAGAGAGAGGRGVPAGAYLVSRNFGVSALRGGEAYAGAMAAHGATLLDGELLRRTSDMGSGTGALAVYMVFDCVCADGKDVAGQPLKARLHELAARVREPFRALDDGLRAEGSPGLPLYILAKNIVSKGALGSVLDKIVTAAAAAAAHGGGGGGLAPLESEVTAGTTAVHRLYRDGRRVNPTDGLIFTPGAASYRELFQGQGGDEPALPLIKWKFLDECTVDYALKAVDLERACRVGGGGGGGGGASSSSSSGSGSSGGGRGAEGGLLWLPLSLRCKGSLMEIARCRLSLEQARGYLAMLERLPGDADCLVVECAFEKECSAWGIRRVRVNKGVNALRTGWSTLESLVEDVTEEELVRRLRGDKRPPEAAPGPRAAAGAAE